MTGEIWNIQLELYLTKKKSAVAKHFCLTGHCLDDVKIQILEFIRKPPMLKSTMKYRKTRELHWI